MLNNKGRVENSIRNSASGIAVQIITTLLGLAVRTVFIRCLVAEYLGINGLFSNILSILSLAELGVGNAIVYNMYKPIAEKNEKQIAKLMNLYRFSYSIIGLIVAVLGVSVIPFLGSIIRNQPDIDNLTLYYLLFLGNTVLSYFFAYKRSIFLADQRERVITYFDFAFQLIRYTLQVLVLLLFKSFIAYLLIQIGCTFLTNVFLSIYADRQYPFLVQYNKETLSAAERTPIFENIKALFIYKVGSTALDGTDNIIISAFDGIISVGLLSNYSLLTGSVQTLLNKVIGSMTGSVGNFIATEDPDRYEELLNRLTFLSFLIYGLTFVGSMAVLNPFVALWAGPEYVMHYPIVLVHCLNIYIFGMMNAIWTFRSTMGLFVYGRWRPLVSAAVNIVVSIWLAKKIGLLGVLLGTTFTRVVTNVWYDPLIVFKNGLNKTPFRYYFKWLGYLLICFADIGLLWILSRCIEMPALVGVLLCGCAAVLLFMASIILTYRKSEEFQWFLNLLKRGMNRGKT